MAFFSGPKRHSYTPSDEENKNQKQAAIVTTTSGKQYSLSKQEMDWIKNRYALDNANTYGYDLADQQAKAAGQLSAKTLSSYGKSNVDQQLAQMGLPSQKNLDKYIGQYQQWNTGGIGKVFGNSLSSQDWSSIGNLYKQSWKYTDSAEDQMRKQKGLMPSALEANYTDTEVDDQLKAGGLPSFKDFNTYLGQYNNQRGIDALYANAAASYTAMRTRQDVNTKEYVKDDNKNYTLVVDPATGRTETKTGRDWYAQAFYEELGRTDKDGNLVYGDIMPLLKPSKTGEESYIDPTKSYIEQMDNLYKAKAKEDKVEFDGHSAFSYDDFAKHYPEYYDAYIKDMPWSDSQTIDDRLGVIKREADAQAEKDFYDITDKWFDDDKGIVEFVERYQKDYPPPTPGKNGEKPDYETYYETMFSNMLAHGVSKNIVRKAMKEVRKGFQYDSTNERYDAITDAYANVNKAENKKAREEEQAKLWDYVNYDPNDPASVAAVSGKPVKEEESGLSVNDWEKLAKDYIKQAKDEDENDEDTIELARKAVENALAGFFDPDEGIGYTGTVDDVIKVINEIEAQNWNNPAAMRKALEDYGFSKYASYSGLAADLTQNWSDDDKVDLALSLGDTKLIENADKSGEFDKGYKDIFGNAAVTGNENVHPYTKLDSADFNYALDWAKEQIADGKIPEGKAYNILAGLGFQDELEHYIPKQWHEAHYRDVIVPKMFEESGGDVRAMWEGMTEEERAATAQKMVDELSDEQMAEIFSSPTWWKSNPTVYRTFGQAFEQQLAGMVPTFASGMIADGAVIADAIGAAITDRPAMKDSTNKLLEAQRFAQNYGSVYDGTNGAEVSSFVTDAANEVMKMMLYGNLGGVVGSSISGAVGGTAVGSALSKALSSSKALKWVPGFFSTMLNSTPFMASSFAGHYAEAKQMGATNAEAAKYGTVMGVAEGALEGANFDYLWGRALGANKFGEMLTKGAALFKESDVIAAARIANMGASFAGEATEEGLGYFGETLWKMNSRWGRDSTEFSASDMLKEALMGGAIGLLGSAVSVGEINRRSILVDYWANHTSLPSDIVDVATGEKVFNGGTADERAAWENGDTHIMSAGEFAENLYQLDVLNKTEDAKKAQEEHKKRVDEANKKYNAVKAIETNLRAEASALDPSDPEYASKLKDLNSKIRKAAQDSHDASLVREDEITKSENAMDARIEAESRQREAINKAMRDHWAGIYLQNKAEVASRDYDAIRKNWARDRQDGATVKPEAKTGDTSAAEAGARTVENPWKTRSKLNRYADAPTRPFTAEDENAVVKAAKKLKYRGAIHFVDSADENWNGYITLGNGDIYINKAKLSANDTKLLQNNPALWIMEHELNHFMKSRGGKSYNDFRNAVVKMIKDSPKINGNDVKYNEYVNNLIKSRESQGLGKLTFAQAEEELVGNFAMEYLFDSEDAIRSLFQTNGNVGQQILSWLRYQIDKAKLRRSKDSWARDILDIERMYAKAYRETRNKPQSAESIAEHKGNVAYHAWDRPMRDELADDYKPGDYDYTKPLVEQFRDVKAKTFPQNNAILIGRTGDFESLQDIGFGNMPITYAHKHASDAINGAKDSDHTATPEELAEAFEQLKHPIAIVTADPDNEKRGNSVVAFVDISTPATKIVRDRDGNIVYDEKGEPKREPVYNRKGERKLERKLVALQLEGRARVDGNTIDSMHVTSTYFKNNSANILAKALEREANGGTDVFYLDSKKAQKFLERNLGKENAARLLARDNVQFVAGHEALSGRVHSINDEGSPVKGKIKGQTDTEQFKRWFGTFNEYAKGDFSKFVNPDGTPMVLYRVPGEGNENMYTLEPVEDGAERFYISANKILTPTYLETQGRPRNLSPEDMYRGLTNANEAALRRANLDRAVIQTELPDGTKVYTVLNPKSAKSADKNVGLFSPYINNTAFSGGDESLDVLGSDYVGVANPLTGVTADDDKAYMDAALAGDEETTGEMIRDMYLRNGYRRGYHGDRRPAGSYTEINWDERNERGDLRYLNRQMFISEEDEFPSYAYVGDSGQDMQARPISYGPAEVDMLNEYIADMNDEFGTDYELDTWYTDKNGNRLTDEEADAMSSDEVVPHYGLYHADSDDESYEFDETSSSMLARKLMLRLDPPNDAGESIVDNPLSGGVIELFVKGNRTNETRGYNQAWDEIPFEGEFPDEYRYNTITLSRDEETGKRTLTAEKADGTVVKEENIPAGQYELLTAFNKVFGKGQDVFSELFGWKRDGREFSGVAQMDDDGNLVAKDVVVNPDTHKVYKREGKGRVTDKIGIEDREKGYELSRITNIYDGAEYPSNVLIARNENLIKSADPIMYDSKGKIVPLHMRGNELVNTLYSGTDDALAALGEQDEEVLNPRNGVTRGEEEKYDALADGYVDFSLDSDGLRDIQSMVSDVAKRNGFTELVLHGTNFFGFTKPDVSVSDDGLSFFAAKSPLTARTYMDDSDVGDSMGVARISDATWQEPPSLSDFRKGELKKTLTMFANEVFGPDLGYDEEAAAAWADATVEYAEGLLVDGRLPYDVASSLSQNLREQLSEHVNNGGEFNGFSEELTSRITLPALMNLLDVDVLDQEQQDILWDWVNIGFEESGLSDEIISKAIERTGVSSRAELVDLLTNAILEDTDVPVGIVMANELVYNTYVVDEETGEITNYDESYENAINHAMETLAHDAQDFIDKSTSHRHQGIDTGSYRLYANTDGMFRVGDPYYAQPWYAINVGERIAKEMRGMGLNPADGWNGTAFKTRAIAKWAKANGYTGVIYENIIDSGGQSDRYSAAPDTVYNFFSPETQLRSADPVVLDDKRRIIPLSNRFDPASGMNDFRYSGKDESMGALGESQDQGQSASAVDAAFDEKVRRYGAKPQGRAPRARDTRVPERANAQRRFSDFLRSLVESNKVGNDQVEAIKRKVLEEDWLSYIPVSQRERMEEARAYIAQRQPLEAQQDFHDMVTSGKLGVKTNALGLQLLSDAAARGDIESVLNIANDLQIAATEAGQSAQIFNVLKELKGVGSAWYMNGLIKKLNTKYADRIQSGKMNPITVPVELMENLSKAVTVDEIADAENAVAKEIARQLPLTWEARISNWRYFSMLANPTTHFRNITGNVLMKGLNAGKDIVATGLEKALNIDESERAHAILTPEDKSTWGGFAEESYKEQARNLSGGGKLSFQTFVDQNMRKFDTKWVNALAEFNFKALEGEDIAFIRPAYKNALMQYMKAQGFTLNEKGEAGKVDAKGKWVPMTNGQMASAVEWASNQAWKATFRDASSLATMLNKLSKENAVSRLLVEGVMPFKKTPINIAKRGLEYSPAGIIMGTVQLATKVKQGKMSAAQAIDNLASGITGTALMALGVALAKAGLIRAGGEKDKKLETYLEDTGDQTYAMKFGDKSINMSSIAPATIPLFMGVALNEMIEQSGETIDLSTITDTIAGTLNPFMEMSFMASLNSALKNYNNNGIGGALGSTLMTAAQNYGSQYLPTLGGKIAQFFDPTRRTTKSDATSPIGGNMDYYMRSLAKKVPGLEATLQPDVDIWGRTDTKDSFGDWALDFANKFILPTNVKITNRDAVDNELIRVVESTGVTDFLPSDGNKYFTVKGERYNMNARQYAQYSQERGQAAYVALKELMASPAYQAASDETKADMLNKAKEAAYKQVNNLWKEKLGALG